MTNEQLIERLEKGYNWLTQKDIENMIYQTDHTDYFLELLHQNFYSDTEEIIDILICEIIILNRFLEDEGHC